MKESESVYNYKTIILVSYEAAAMGQVFIGKKSCKSVKRKKIQLKVKNVCPPSHFPVCQATTGPQV